MYTECRHLQGRGNLANLLDESLRQGERSGKGRAYDRERVLNLSIKAYTNLLRGREEQKRKEREKIRG